jgi:lipoprotein-anchoring transpeptidase ErfK/SrfK
VGRSGFAWSGAAVVGMKRRWPRWVPPEDMIYRDEKAAKWMNGMPGGPENPLGARALYLHSNGEDTLYRIHGTNEPRSIGKAMSSGCIRMLNENVDELYLRVEIGTPVTVLPPKDNDDILASTL